MEAGGKEADSVMGAILTGWAELVAFEDWQCSVG